MSSAGETNERGIGCEVKRGSHGDGRVTFLPRGAALGLHNQIVVTGAKADQLRAKIIAAGWSAGWTDNLCVRVIIADPMGRQSPDFRRTYPQEWITDIQLTAQTAPTH